MSQKRERERDDDWEQIVSIDNNNNDRYISLREVIQNEYTTSYPAFSELELEDKINVTLRRIENGNYSSTLGILGKGILSKERCIYEISERTSIGATLIELEERIIESLIQRNHKSSRLTD